MATNSVDLYSYLAGLEVSRDEVLEAELIAYQVLAAKYPDLDLRSGTGLYDMVIRPAATLMALTNKALVFYFAQNTLSDVDDNTPQIFVDKMMSNWFLQRKQGNKAILNTRLYFARSKSISLSTDVFFSTDNSLKFFPAVSVSYAEDQLTYDSANNQYFIDVELTAEKAGTVYNITSGSLIYFTNFDPYFLHAEINYLSQSAEDVESNSQFISRSETAISTRNLINVPSIDSNIREIFSGVPQVVSFGFGDPEMKRDQIKILPPGLTDPVWIHNGGKVDVFCRVPVSSSILQFTSDQNGKIYITGSIYKIVRSSIPGGDDDDTLPFYLTQPVTSITRTGTVATVTTPAPHGYSTGDLITIQNAAPLAYTGTFSITVVSPTTFTYTVSSTATTPATGVITAGVPYPFTLSSQSWVTQTPTSITQTSGVATVTLPDHGLTVGERVKVSGANQINYNQTAVITSVLDKDKFTYAVPSGTVTPATGTISVTYVDRQKEEGFSERQTLVADFGPSQGNKTASFVVYFHENIDGLQSYISDASNRVAAADLLARGFNLIALDIGIVGYNSVTPDSGVASTTVTAYLDSLLPGEPFIMADLLSKLYAAGIKTIKTPLDVTFTKYWNDNFTNTSGTITDVLNPEDTKCIFLLNSVTTSIEAI